MDEKSTEQRKRGVFSGREVFYFFFALLVFGVLVYVFNMYWAVHREKEAEARRLKYAKSLEAAQAIERSGGYFISETQVLYHQYYSSGLTNKWAVYDLKHGEITDGNRYVRPLEKFASNHDVFMNWCWLSGWNGNLVLTTSGSTNTDSWIFEWRTNSDEVRAFNIHQITGNLPGTDLAPAVATGSGWSACVFVMRVGPKGVIAVDQAGAVTTNLFPSNTLAGSMSEALFWPFETGAYLLSRHFDGRTAGIRIFSLTNQNVTFSNNAVKLPRTFDKCYACPDPSGRRVLWILGVEPKLNWKLRSILPAVIAPQPAKITWYLYCSDLRATKFDFIGTTRIYSPTSPSFLWGPNADSIWVMDDDEGIKRFVLK